MSWSAHREWHRGYAILVFESRFRSDEEEWKNPDLFRKFAGVLYYNDQGVEIPEEMPTMQIFGWKALKPHQDRITVDDVKVAELSIDFFLKANVKRVAMVWRKDMIRNFYVQFLNG